MNALRLTLKILFAFFLSICVLVHVAGLFTHVSDESVLSHLIHITTYGACLFIALRPTGQPAIIFPVAALYPFFFHARCAVIPLIEEQRYNAICWLVVFMLPLISWWVWVERSDYLKNQR